MEIPGKCHSHEVQSCTKRHKKERLGPNAVYETMDAHTRRNATEKRIGKAVENLWRDLISFSRVKPHSGAAQCFSYEFGLHGVL